MSNLSVLSLNCWGLYLIASKRRARLLAIADALCHADYDIIALQEVWVKEDFQCIKSRLSSRLPFAKYFFSGALGSGLAIFSRFPILESSYVCYTLAGHPLMLWHGDYYVGKGCGSVTIEHPKAGVLQVFNTHLHAEYGKTPQYQNHLLSEGWELALLVRSAIAHGRQVIVAGDFNSVPDSLVYRIITQHGFMADSWQQIKTSRQSSFPNTSNVEHLSTRIDPIQQAGITCNSPLNTWSSSQPPIITSEIVGDRIDYLFYLSGSRLKCIDSRVALTDYIPMTSMSYSDHFGVHSTFTILPSDTVASSLLSPTTTYLESATVLECIEILKRGQIQSKRTSERLYISSALLLLMAICMYVLTIQYAGQPTHAQNSYVLLVTLLCGLILIVCSASAPLLFVVGFVFGHKEEQAQMQLETDLEVVLSHLDKAQHSLC
ncbi:Endonuclease/exonuclease/phosphatase [Spinellus fusiger]|nr:Endonuclease/exonuclease/phosphatase [Spinellus fusiger]